MTFRIYFEKRQIVICSDSRQIATDPNSVVLSYAHESTLKDFVAMFEKNTSLQKVYIASEDPFRSFEVICSCMSQVQAAGGLVRNRRGDYLMIFRNGMWDLPKGKHEAGEDILVTALREVREETGLEEIEASELICVTHHCYRWKGQGELIVKHTYWYDMEYTIPTELIPQKEEDITKVTWVAKSALPAFLNDTYPSITEVFHKAEIL